MKVLKDCCQDTKIFTSNGGKSILHMTQNKILGLRTLTAANLQSGEFAQIVNLRPNGETQDGNPTDTETEKSLGINASLYPTTYN